MTHWTRFTSQITFKAFHPKATRIHILLECTWNFLQNRSHTGSQIRSQPVPKIGIIPGIFSDHNALKLKLSQEDIWKELKYMELKEHPAKE